MLVLAIENSAAMSYHYQNLYDIYLDKLIDNYLANEEAASGTGAASKANQQKQQQQQIAPLKRNIIFSTFPDGEIHFKTSDKDKIKAEFAKLEMSNGMMSLVMAIATDGTLEEVKQSVKHYLQF